MEESTPSDQNDAQSPRGDLEVSSLLDSLDKLHAAGMLTDEEYTLKKRALIEKVDLTSLGGQPKHRERRRIQRRHVRYFLVVNNTDTGEQFGLLVDITPEGVMLINEDPVETNKLFNLTVVLPREIDDSSTIELVARSIWCEKDINPHYYATGFRIEHINQKDIERIEMLAEEYGLRVIDDS